MKRGKDLISQNNLSLFKKRTFNVSKNVLGFVEILVSATALACILNLIPICGESGVEPEKCLLPKFELITVEILTQPLSKGEGTMRIRLKFLSKNDCFF